jgi:hypothetical protein
VPLERNGGSPPAVLAYSRRRYSPTGQSASYSTFRTSAHEAILPSTVQGFRSHTRQLLRSSYIFGEVVREFLII